MNHWKRLARILGLHCAEATEFLSWEMDEPLPLPERAALWGHLLACGPCRRFRKQIRLIREALRGLGSSHYETGPNENVLSTEARGRIARAIGEAGNDGQG